MKKRLSTADMIKLFFTVISLAAAIVLFVQGAININKTDNTYRALSTQTFVRVGEALSEDYSDETVCPVEFVSQDGKYTCQKDYTLQEWQALPTGATITGYIYASDSGSTLAFSHEASEKDIISAQKDINATNEASRLGAGVAMLLVAAGLAVMCFFGRHFTLYEQVWFISILVAAAAVSVLFPEEETNGINGLIIMGLYLADTFLNILCELLISKQSKWNFIVSVFVEITEIAICIVLAYRFATLASTLFFWLPCDIISFINWHKHPDKKEEELTVVRSLKGWQEVLIIAGIVVWTIGIGYLLTTIDLGTDIFGGNRTLEVIVCYLDACVSAVGVVNGVFILLRLREQWIAWYLSAIIEAAINIMSGQFVLLVLKVGYLTNTTYGYIKWTKYIKANAVKKGEEKPLLTTEQE